LGVAIRQLRKEFPAKDKKLPPQIAVNNLTLNMYEGQILSLLGHNGQFTLNRTPDSVQIINNNNKTYVTSVNPRHYD